jgi:hypothetical protein
MSARQKSYHRKQLLVFMLHVIVVGEIILEVVFENHTKFGFVTIIYTVMWEEICVDRPSMPITWHVKE